ncbi:MAG: hypothetical protein IPJ00_13055 [Saprospirales bacterium]|nr:hypothetical protein [Saprospirales bacterium]
MTGRSLPTNTNGDTIAVMWTAAGQGQVCVTADNANGSSLQTCLTVNIRTTPSRCRLCWQPFARGDSYPFAGNTYEPTGIYTVTPTSSGLRQPVTTGSDHLEAEAVIRSLLGS